MNPMCLHAFEFYILDFIREHLTTSFGDIFMPFISFLGNKGGIWILIACVLFIFPKTRKSGLAVGFGLIFSLILCNIILKNWTARIRPFDINTAVKLLITPPTDFSFPSGHTSAAMAAVSALYYTKNKCWIPAAVLAVLMAFSRLYLYAHFPTDILGGIICGLLCGWAGSRLSYVVGEKYGFGQKKK